MRELAIEAQQSAKSAHLRVDRLDRLVFWMGTTVIGSLIAGAITLLFKFAGSDRIYGHFLFERRR